MKRIVLTIIIVSFFRMGYGQMPSVVSAPVLEGMMTEQMTWELDERIRKTLSSTITGLQSVQSFINRANQLSCVSTDFSNSIELAQRYGFYNCYLENKANGVGNDLMMVMDMANSAMSIALVAEPQERLVMIDQAINRYTNIESDMWEIINRVYSEIKKRKKKVEELHEVESLSFLPLVPAEISGRPMELPPAGNFSIGSPRDQTIYSSNAGGNVPDKFELDQGLSAHYRLINIIFYAVFVIGLVGVTWVYATGKNGANMYLIAYVIALLVGNVIKGLLIL